MAIKALKPRALKKNDLPKFDEAVYSKVTLGSLIVYAVHFLLEQGIAITLDDLVSACFLLFPQKFALKKFSKWPDSAVVGRHWQECRHRRYVTASDELNFRLTVKGTRIARKVAKVLGMEFPKPKATAQPKPPVKKSTKKTRIVPEKHIPVPVTVAQAQALESKPVVEKPIKKTKSAPKKKATLPVRVEQAQIPVSKPISAKPAKKVMVAPKKKAIPPVTAEQAQIPESKPVVEKPLKKAKPAPKKKVTPPVTMKQTVIPELKPPVIKQKKAKSAPRKKITPSVTVEQAPIPESKPVVEKPKKTKITPKRKVTPPVTAKPVPIPGSKQVAEKQKKAKGAPKMEVTPPAAQLQLPLPKSTPKKKIEPVMPIWREKIIPPEHTVRVVKPQPEKEIVPAPSVTPEAKLRAGKFVRMMETSDAYIQYRKNGERSNINEFDFRSLLLCTMESSSETLARNVAQFKGYADVHNRRDLIVFLDFCGTKFSHLLVPPKKISTQRKK